MRSDNFNLEFPILTAEQAKDLESEDFEELEIDTEAFNDFEYANEDYNDLEFDSLDNVDQRVEESYNQVEEYSELEASTTKKTTDGGEECKSYAEEAENAEPVTDRNYSDLIPDFQSLGLSNLDEAENSRNEEGIAELYKDTNSANKYLQEYIGAQIDTLKNLAALLFQLNSKHRSHIRDINLMRELANIFANIDNRAFSDEFYFNQIFEALTSTTELVYKSPRLSERESLTKLVTAKFVEFLAQKKSDLNLLYRNAKTEFQKKQIANLIGMLGKYPANTVELDAVLAQGYELDRLSLEIVKANLKRLAFYYREYRNHEFAISSNSLMASGIEVTPEELAKYQGETEEVYKSILSLNKTYRITHTASDYIQYLNKLEYIDNNTTGIEEFDRILGGIDEKSLMYLAAPSGNGKSSFLDTITMNRITSKRKSHLLYLSAEISKERFIEKLAKLNLFEMLKDQTNEITNNNLNAIEAYNRKAPELKKWLQDPSNKRNLVIDSVKDLCKKYSDYMDHYLHFDDFSEGEEMNKNHGFTIENIVYRVESLYREIETRNAIRKLENPKDFQPEKLEFLFIDYLQAINLANPDQNSARTYDKLLKISESLRTLKNKYNLKIICLLQTSISRDGKDYSPENMPGAADFGDCKQVIRDCEYALTMILQKYKTGANGEIIPLASPLIWFKCVKNRYGESGQCFSTVFLDAISKIGGKLCTPQNMQPIRLTPF